MGTTIVGYPFYVTPKVTVFKSSKTALALGDIFMIGTWGNFYLGNIAYGVLTIGDQFKNVSLGAGYFHVSGDIANTINAPLMLHVY
jgi:hypothetical protein